MKQYLKTHIMIHEGIKPNKCYMCEKDFVQLSDLKRHMKRHDKDEEHKCDTCSSVFLNIENLGLVDHKEGLVIFYWVRIVD